MTEKENNQQNIIEDLDVNEIEAEEVKGGPIYMKIEGVDGDVTPAAVKPGYDLQTNIKV
ncbi:MAG: hypothetical protein AB7U82_01895 [Blastocatellales bacterium]